MLFLVALSVGGGGGLPVQKKEDVVRSVGNLRGVVFLKLRFVHILWLARVYVERGEEFLLHLHRLAPGAAKGAIMCSMHL